MVVSKDTLGVGGHLSPDKPPPRSCGILNPTTYLAVLHGTHDAMPAEQGATEGEVHQPAILAASMLLLLLFIRGIITGNTILKPHRVHIIAGVRIRHRLGNPRMQQLHVRDG